MNDPTLTLLIGYFAFLTLSTLVGDVMSLRNPGNGSILNLNARIRAWWVMSVIIIAALWTGAGGVTILFALISMASLREFITIAAKRKSDHWSLAAAFYVILPIQYVSVWMGWYGFFAIFIPVYAFFFLPLLSVIRQDTQDFLARVTQTQWGLMISVYALSHIPALLILDFSTTLAPYWMIVFLIACSQGGDVMQYIFGKTFGKTPMVPKISPNKTWGGFIGGTLGVVALGAALHFITPFSPVWAGLIAGGITMAGTVGGLVMSAIKRDKKIKDWGHTIQGHGGFLDRVDSLAFSAPLLFHVSRFFWT